MPLICGIKCRSRTVARALLLDKSECFWNVRYYGDLVAGVPVPPHTLGKGANRLLIVHDEDTRCTLSDWHPLSAIIGLACRNRKPVG